MAASGKTFFQNASQWIQRNGGYVHPSLNYDDKKRQVFLGSNCNFGATGATGDSNLDGTNGAPVADDGGGHGAKSIISDDLNSKGNDDNAVKSSKSHGDSNTTNTTKSTNVSIEAGTTLLEIPDSCLLSLHSVEEDTAFGKTLFPAVHSVQEECKRQGDKDVTQKLGGNNCGVGSPSANGALVDRGLYHEAEDVILALFLAYLWEKLYQLPLENQKLGCVEQNNVENEGDHKERTLRQDESSNVVRKVCNSTDECEDRIQKDQQSDLLKSHQNNASTPDSKQSINKETSFNDIHLSNQSETSSASDNQSNKPNSIQPWMFFRPYLDTLPCTASLGEISHAHPESFSSAASKAENAPNHHLLPRQWPASLLERRLKGTSLYDRIINEQNGLKREYTLVRDSWIKRHVDNGGTVDSDSKKDKDFPSFESYDTMMAMVTSRGFAGLGYDGVDAMIPLLDLLDHVRGGIEEGNDGSETKNDIVKNDDNAHAQKDGGDGKVACSDGTKNNELIPETKLKSRSGADVRYQRFEMKASETDQSGSECRVPKRQKIEQKGGVRVVAAKWLPMGSILQMTYGAKSNVTLLGRYGFCIPNNVEPDGSCNDILEIQLKHNASPVPLQRGPKSYSYGPFLKALGLFYDDSESNENCKNEATSLERNCMDEVDDANMGDSGLDAFLDSCENDMGDDCSSGGEADGASDEEDLESYLYGSSSKTPSRATPTSLDLSLKDDIHALNALVASLEFHKERYKKQLSLQSTDIALTGPAGAGNISTNARLFTKEDEYCMLLAKSELETIEFYLRAAKSIKTRLAIYLAKHGTDEYLNSSQKFQEESLSNSTIIASQCGSINSSSKHVDDLVESFFVIRYPHVKD